MAKISRKCQESKNAREVKMSGRLNCQTVGMRLLLGMKSLLGQNDCVGENGGWNYSYFQITVRDKMTVLKEMF